jgi:serine/threonine protein kinase
VVVRMHFILHVSPINSLKKINLFGRLFGRPPFNSDNDDELEELVSEGKYSFPTSRPVSDDGTNIFDSTSVMLTLKNLAKDLVSHLLDVNPLKRYSAAQILEHRWIKVGVGYMTTIYELFNIDDFCWIRPRRKVSPSN